MCACERMCVHVRACVCLRVRAGWEGEAPRRAELPSLRGCSWQAPWTPWRDPTLPGPCPQPGRPSAHRMVREQCCHSQLEELHCATGINLANEQDSCAMPHSDNTSLEATFVKVRTRPPACQPREAWALSCLQHLPRPVLLSSREGGGGLSGPPHPAV